VTTRYVELADSILASLHHDIWTDLLRPAGYKQDQFGRSPIKYYHHPPDRQLPNPFASSVSDFYLQPELLSGTLRENLDPFDELDDATLNGTLRAAGLFSIQTDVDKDRLTLETAISSGGGNLSIGQRQILALARAIVRKSKLLILDEGMWSTAYEY
jgi:ABC-type iron transport system FetAB ATPase subunit